jgi:DNA transposition AAA+ family ATPase
MSSHTPTPPSQPSSDDSRWTPPFLTLPVHKLLEHQLRLGLRGVESTLMHGPPGVGKTAAVSRYLDGIRRSQMAEQLATGQLPAEILFYETSKASGPKTVLADIYSLLIRRPISKRSRQDWSPTLYVDQITERVIDDNVRLIIIDEAQMIDAANIDLLRQLPDAAARRGHSLRLFLIGNEGLVRNVRQTGQDGERFTGDVAYPALSPSIVAPHLGSFHPGLGALRDGLEAKAWKALERDLLAAAAGSFRRLTTLIENAHELALARGSAMIERDIRLAIAKIRTSGET